MSLNKQRTKKSMNFRNAYQPSGTGFGAKVYFEKCLKIEFFFSYVVKVEAVGHMCTRDDLL